MQKRPPKNVWWIMRYRTACAPDPRCKPHRTADHFFINFM